MGRPHKGEEKGRDRVCVTCAREFTLSPGRKAGAKCSMCRHIRTEKTRLAGLESARKWRAKNPGRQAELSALWRAANPLANRESVRRWKEANPESVRAHENQKRARQRQAEGRVTASEWESVLDWFDRCCAYCGARGDLEMEHVTPLSRGGAHSADNVVPACRACNAKKYNRGILSMVNVAFAQNPE